MQRSFNFQAGDIILIAYPFTNLKGGKVRPALVIRQPKDEDLLLAPISTTIAQTRSDQLISQEDYEENPLPILSCVRYEKLFTLSMSLVIKTVSKIKPQLLQAIRHKVIDFIAEGA